MVNYEIVFLGTGAGHNEERCQSALALVRSDGKFILFDAGSGVDTVRQILRAGLRPADLKGVFITHRHWDHVGGLWSLLIWLRLRCSPVMDQLAVFGSEETVTALEHMHRVSAHRGDVPLVALRIAQPYRPFPEVVVEAFPVRHIPGSFGYRVLAGKAVVAITGDTCPAESVAEAAAEADFLVHEATWDRAHQAYARVTSHSTAEEAGEIARRARAKQLIVTHLPPASEIPPEVIRDEASATYGGIVSLAWDLRRIPIFPPDGTVSGDYMPGDVGG